MIPILPLLYPHLCGLNTDYSTSHHRHNYLYRIRYFASLSFISYHRMDQRRAWISDVRELHKTTVTLTRYLLNCEDRYRSIGDRYYNRAYFQIGNDSVPDDLRVTIVHAYHGSTPVHLRPILSP